MGNNPGFVMSSITRRAIAKVAVDFFGIEIKTEQWDRREAVSFNRDGFIGIAGWADNANVKPILDALVEWSVT